MEALIAFENEARSYVLPRASGAQGLIMMNQPRFISRKEAEGLPRLIAEDPVCGWQRDCEGSAMLSGSESRHRLFCWWMGLSQDQRDHYFLVSSV